MYECKVCKKTQIEAAEIHNNIIFFRNYKAIFKNAERNDFTIAENIVKIKELENRRQENRYVIEHQKETRPFRNHSNTSNTWYRQNQYEDNFCFRNQNKEERRLFDEMKGMIHDPRNGQKILFF